MITQGKGKRGRAELRWGAGLVGSLMAAGYLSWRYGVVWPTMLLAAVVTGVAIYLLATLKKAGWYGGASPREVEGRIRDPEQTVRLSAVYEVANAMSEAVELPELLGQGLERAVRALGLDGGRIHLVGDDGGEVMHLGAVFGDDPRLWSDEQTIRVGECICGEAAAGLLPVTVDDTSTDPRISGRTCGAGGVVSVPLKASGGSLGVLSIWSCDPYHFALQDIELLTAIASFLAAAIENARIRSEMKERIAELSREVQQLTIVEERERIGREMHDGLAQTLGLLNLQIELVKEAVGAADWAAAQDELANMDAYLGEAYNDVREALGNLRSTEPQGEAFVPALEEYVREFGRRNGLEAVLVTENGQGPFCLPALVEVQLQRVIHEALTNVRRHAAAGRVEVRVRGRGEGWEVTVVDDGVGFDPLASGRAGKGSYGLSTMRERVESLGGRFSIASQPGEGTQVAVFVPCDAGN